MLDAYRKVVVTGGAGFMGRHLVRALLDRGKDVAIVDNLSTSLSDPLPEDAELHRVDIRRPAELAAAFTGADLIFHTAANASGTVSVEDPRFDFETNAVGTFNVLEAAWNAGVKRVVYTSSASVYGIPQSPPMTEQHPTKPFMPYGTSKLMGELAGRAWYFSRGLPVVAIRPLGVYGPGENFQSALVEVSRYLRWHLNGLPIRVVGDPDGKTRDFVHVSDVVQAQLVLADRGVLGEVYNVGSGEEVSMRQLVDIIGAASGRPATMDVISEITDDTYRLIADFSKLRALGYEPKTYLAEGVRDLVECLGDRPELPGGSTIFSVGQHGER